MITWDQVCDVAANALDDTRTFMTQHHGSIPGKHVPERHVRVADAGGTGSNHHLGVLRLVHTAPLQQECPALGVYHRGDPSHGPLLEPRVQAGSTSTRQVLYVVAPQGAERSSVNTLAHPR